MNNVKIIKNFFNENDLNIIKKELENAYDFKLGWVNGKSKHDWALGVDGGKVDIITFPLNQVIDEEVYTIIKNKVETEFQLKVHNIGFHYCRSGSHMGWHNESGEYTGAVTIYLNKIWNRNWGGYFLYEEEDKTLKLQIPQYNKAIFQFAKTFHATTPVYEGFPIRKSIQVFFK
jgi:hypothetical protein